MLKRSFVFTLLLCLLFSSGCVNRVRILHVYLNEPDINNSEVHNAAFHDNLRVSIEILKLDVSGVVTGLDFVKEGFHPSNCFLKKYRIDDGMWNYYYLCMKFALDYLEEVSSDELWVSHKSYGVISASVERLSSIVEEAKCFVTRCEARLVR